MERVWIAVLLICFGHDVARAENQKKYFVLGKSIELRPPPGTAAITSIIWKLNENLVAEWTESETNVEYYPNFKDRSFLTPTTGILVINSATEKDAGVYAVEINKKLLGDTYEFTRVEEVPKPRLWVKPGINENQRNLSCDGDVEKAGPVEYWWDITEDETWVKLDRKITLEKNETTQRIQEFSCKLVNPVGEKKSDPGVNPFYEEPVNPAVWVAPVLILMILTGIGIGCWKKDFFIRRFCPPQGTPAGNGGVAPAETANLNQQT